MPENNDDLTLLIDAARAAGEIAARHWKRDPEVWHKADDAGPVTEADLAIDKMLTAELKGARPDYGLLSEETADTPARLSEPKTFIIDPIDGTRAFIEGSKDFAHSLAIAEQGQITAAVVFLPMSDKLYCATLGGGATLNGAPLSASSQHEDENATILTAKPNLSPQWWPGGVPAIDRQFRSSLAYRLALVAQGRFDGMVTFRDSWEWDIAAGALIATEAGAAVTDRLGAALQFNNPHPKTPGVLAAAPKLHERLLARIIPPA